MVSPIIEIELVLDSYSICQIILKVITLIAAIIWVWAEKRALLMEIW